ncbi:hypothetical protein SAMN05660349_02741 [Macellibacteroides fermentans]|jgi:hypothetical protein|uniref:Uncharacterized protein n=1 Tax=Parabacteroides chartae TaxID=1037355 RepID=A0A1T5E216_9BACT|nr:hypothetical protein SAMN05660349_02741 [Parabacteroides chartae]
MKVCEQKQIFSIIATEVILNSSKTQKKGIYLQAGKSLSGMYFFF